MAEPFICRIVKRGCGASSTSTRHDLDSGIIAEIEQSFMEDLLTKPSCFQEKYNRSMFQSPRNFVLLTAHSNLYEEAESARWDIPAKDYIDNYSLVLDFEIPLHKCVLRVDDDRCVAVSCCGVDSILLLYDNAQLDFSLRAHRDVRTCCIKSDFLILFLDVEALKDRIGSPPVLRKPSALQAATCHDVPYTRPFMYWRTAEGKVDKLQIDLHLQSTSGSSRQEAGPPPAHSLKHDIEVFSEQRCISIPADCHIGAPIIWNTPDGTSVIGINAGGTITTMYGIFELLKGGLVPFLTAMTPKHPQTSMLMPSRWKMHVIPFVSTQLPTRSSVLELLHHLLHHDTDGEMQILKFRLEGGTFRREVVSGLEVYTAIFRHYGKLLEKEQAVEFESERVCTCLEQIDSDMAQISAYFANDEKPPDDIIVALFECFEAMQSFNCEDMAARILEKNRKHLDKIAIKDNIDSNGAVNKSFKHIDILARERGNIYRKPLQATNGDKD